MNTLILLVILTVHGEKTVKPIAKPILTRGELNVLKHMSKARKTFGKRDAIARNLFNKKVLLFEKPMGFQGEAEMEAAQRVLNGR